MNKRQMKIVGEIMALAKDKRIHIMLNDCLNWEREKMRCIVKLSKMLPYTKAKLNKYGEIIDCELAKLKGE